MLQFFFCYGSNESLFSSKTERFWPLVPPTGAVRTQKTWPFSGLWRGNTKSLLGLPLFLIRVRVTELKYLVLNRFIKLLHHWGGACASSSKQARPSGPLVGPRATGVPKSGGNFTTLSGMVLFWPCLGPGSPETVSVGPKMGSFGPWICPAG